MNSREMILNGLSRKNGTIEMPRPWGSRQSFPDLAAQFIAALKNAKGDVYFEESLEAAKEKLEQLCQEQGVKSIVANPEGEILDIQLAGIDLEFVSGGREKVKDACLTADAGLTSAAAAVRTTVGMAASMAVHRADVQAGAAAYTLQNFFILRAHNLAPAVIQQDDMHLVWPIKFIRTRWPGNHRCVDRHRLAGGAAGQQGKPYRRLIPTRDDFLDPDHCHMHFWQAGDHPSVALIGNQDNAAGFGHCQVSAANSHAGVQEFLAQHLACFLRQAGNISRYFPARVIHE